MGPKVLNRGDIPIIWRLVLEREDYYWQENFFKKLEQTIYKRTPLKETCIKMRGQSQCSHSRLFWAVKVKMWKVGKVRIDQGEVAAINKMLRWLEHVEIKEKGDVVQFINTCT